MKQVISHAWNLSEAQACALQQSLAMTLEKEDRFSKISTIAGVDVAYDKNSDRLIAAVVLLDAVSLAVIEQVTVAGVLQFPYIPGLFSFRELPAIADALQQLQSTPDLIVCDGQGIAHPRRFGLACHVGVLFDVPTIGCGKTRLTGTHDVVGPLRGSFQPLVDRNEIIGCALRTQDHINPLYVSIGHRIALATAMQWILHLCANYRQPESTRLADQLVRASMASPLASGMGNVGRGAQ
jgi:deoxyribonuclease V